MNPTPQQISEINRTIAEACGVKPVQKKWLKRFKIAMLFICFPLEVIIQCAISSREAFLETYDAYKNEYKELTK